MEFSEDFFKKEIRCDFEVPEMMKRAWAAQMEVLQVVAEVCEKNGLQYFADWGTLLGAVRHQGFIPWDDDIDICLKREDYNKLIQILPKELPEGFAMAGIYADSKWLQEAFYCPHMKVIEDSEYWNFNDYMVRFHGFPYRRIGVEIFPLDYIPRDGEVAELQKTVLTYGLELMKAWKYFQQKGELEPRVSKMEQLCAVTLPRDDTLVNSLFRLIDSLMSICHEDEADELTEFMFYVDQPGTHMKKEWYREAVKLPFEQMEIAVPCGYREILTRKYGDYMKPVRTAGGHGYPFYGCKEQELVKQIRDTGFTGTVEEFCRKISSGELCI